MDKDLFLMDYKVRERNPHFKNLPDAEREARLVALLRKGFVWHPYYNQFDNPFYGKNMSADAVNFPAHQLDVEFGKVFAGRRPKSIKDIESKFSLSGFSSRLESYLNVSSIVWGSLLFLVSAIGFFLSEVYFLPLLILSTLLIYYWVGYQIMYRRTHSQAEMPPIWHNFASLFRFERILALAFSAYAIWQSELLPEKHYYAGAGIMLMLTLNMIMSRSIIREWWIFEALPLLKKYQALEHAVNE